MLKISLDGLFPTRNDGESPSYLTSMPRAQRDAESISPRDSKAAKKLEEDSNLRTDNPKPESQEGFSDV